MSKSVTRIVLSVLISLGVVFAIYTSVQGASLSSSNGQIGSHNVSGAMVNFNHGRLTVSELNTYNAQLNAFYGQSGSGHDCNSATQSNPDD